MAEHDLLEIAEAAELTAADCARWAREANEKRKSALAVGNEPEAAKQAKIAREWGRQARQLKAGATALRAQLGDKPPVGIKSRGGAAPMEEW